MYWLFFLHPELIDRIFSLGKDNTEDEMTYAVATFAKVVARLRELSPQWDEFQKDRGGVSGRSAAGTSANQQ